MSLCGRYISHKSAVIYFWHIVSSKKKRNLHRNNLLSICLSVRHHPFTREFLNQNLWNIICYPWIYEEWTFSLPKLYHRSCPILSTATDDVSPVSNEIPLPVSDRRSSGDPTTLRLPIRDYYSRTVLSHRSSDYKACALWLEFSDCKRYVSFVFLRWTLYYTIINRPYLLWLRI